MKIKTPWYFLHFICFLRFLSILPLSQILILDVRHSFNFKKINPKYTLKLDFMNWFVIVEFVVRW